MLKLVYREHELLIYKVDTYKGREENCYGPNVINVTVTKGGHPRGSRLYGTSRTIGRGVAKSCS